MAGGNEPGAAVGAAGVAIGVAADKSDAGDADRHEVIDHGAHRSALEKPTTWPTG